MKRSLGGLCEMASSLGVSQLRVEFCKGGWEEMATDGQSASLSWNKATIWGLRPDFYYCQTVVGFVDVGHSVWREDESVVYICCWVLASAVTLESESRGTRGHISPSQIRDFPFCSLLRLAGWLHSGLNGRLYSVPASKEMFVNHSCTRKRLFGTQRWLVSKNRIFAKRVCQLES
jgi:hypothetical protein